MVDAYVARTKVSCLVDATSTNTENPDRQRSGFSFSGFKFGANDSIIARISKGEYIVRAAAVQHFGVDMLHAINNLRLPKFATGGLANLRMPELRNASAPVAAVAAVAASSGDTLYLTIGGQQIGPVHAEKSVSRRIRHAAALFGGATG